jgi:hypothetical protein
MTHSNIPPKSIEKITEIKEKDGRKVKFLSTKWEVRVVRKNNEY